MRPAFFNAGALFGLALLAALAVKCGAEQPPVETPKPLIQIAVEVVEVDVQKTNNLGIAWLNTLHVNEVTVPALFEVGTLTRGQIFADLQFMLQEGTADLLANPKLVTRDGTTANFHVGGEIPYATSGGLGTVNVEFKPYGVDLKISPHKEGGQIVLSLEAEVSSPDQQNSVTLSGNTVPGIRSRRVSSQLTLNPASTLLLAGLIQSDKEMTRQGIPGLMNIPGLGYLFSSRVLTNRRTSIVVFLTPTILETPPSVISAGGSSPPPAEPPKSDDRSPLDHAVLDPDNGNSNDGRS